MYKYFFMFAISSINIFSNTNLGFLIRWYPYMSINGSEINNGYPIAQHACHLNLIKTRWAKIYSYNIYRFFIWHENW